MFTHVYLTDDPTDNIGLTFVGHAFVVRKVPKGKGMMGQEILDKVTLLKDNIRREPEDEDVQNEVAQMLGRHGALPQEGKEDEVKSLLER